MPAYLNDRVLDGGLTILDTEANLLHICSSQPADFAGIAAVSLGTKTSLSVGAPADGSPNGRSTTVAAFADGAVSATGTATHYALVDSVASRLLAAGPLAASQVVTNGNTFGLPAFAVNFPDAL